MYYDFQFTSTYIFIISLHILPSYLIYMVFLSY